MLEDDCACSEHAFVLTLNSAQKCENDCACPDHPLAESACFPSTALYKLASGIYTAQLQECFWLAFSPYAPQGPSVLNKLAWTRLNKFRTPEPILYPVDRTLAEQHLILPDKLNPTPRSVAAEVLTVWLHITNACNLDCPYCYVRKSSASMPLEIGLSAVGQIFAQAQTHGFRSVKLKYAGGESTLQFRLLRTLHGRAQELAEETGIELQAVILSNGTRLREVDADWLVDNNINLMISLDGVGAKHDLMRPLLRGGSSFDALSNTIDNILLPRGIRPFVSVTISSWNAGQIPKR